MNITRRSFLKVMGIAGVAAAVPTVLMEASAAPSVALAQLGLIREVFAYDIGCDLMRLRYDVITSDKELQLHVDICPPAGEFDADPEKFRTIAKGLLENEIKHRGLSWADIGQLPLPDGFGKSGYV